MSEPAPDQSASPDMPVGETGSEGRDSNLGEPPELKVEVASFLHESSETSDEEDMQMPPEPAVSKFTDWVQWKAEECDTPSWWAELSIVLGEDNTRRLAREVRALFQLPKQMHELDLREAPFQAPLALPCLNCWRFLPPVMSACASWDVREIPREKAIAYAWALQHFAEQNDLPKRDESCLLAESIAELRREVKFYLSFMDEEVFTGVHLATEERSCPPVSGAQTEPKSMVGTEDPKFPGWGMVLHPSQLVFAMGETPPPTPTPKPRGRAWVPLQMTPINLPLCLPKTPLPLASPLLARVLALARPPTLPQGFASVMACLKAPELVEVGQEMPIGPMSIGLVATPGISSVSFTQVIKDDMTGLMYMDMVTTLVRRVVLRTLDPNVSIEGPIIEDITDQL